MIYIDYYFPWMNINRIYWGFFPSFLTRQTESSNNRTAEYFCFLHFYQFNLFCTKIKYTNRCNLLSWNNPLYSHGVYLDCRSMYNLSYCLRLNQATPLRSMVLKILLFIGTINTHILISCSKWIERAVNGYLAIYQNLCSLHREEGNNAAGLGLHLGVFQTRHSY